ncbi:MAG: hypothetical protein ABDH28_02950 [Brevinematia bacterium]
MKIKTYLKASIIISGLSFVIIVALLYFSTLFLNQNLPEERFKSYLIFFGIPLASISTLSGIFITYVYFFKYSKFLKTYKEEYEFFISKVFSDTEIRKTSSIENLFKGLEKKESGIYEIIPQEDEFGEFGRIINFLLSNLYSQDIEKSRLLSFQKEVINKLLSFTNVPIVIIRKTHRKKGSIIVSNLNYAFLKTIKAENVVKLASKLLEILKVKQASDKYLYDLVFEIVRAEDLEGLKEIFIGQDIGVEEFLVEVEWFFSPADDRAKKILLLLKDLVKGSDLTEIDQELVLEILEYEEYRKEFSLPDSVSVVEGFINIVAPEDEITFVRKKQDLFYREGLKVRKFRFFLAKDSFSKTTGDTMFDSTITIVPATSKHFSPERMLLLCFDNISTIQ